MKNMLFCLFFCTIILIVKFDLPYLKKDLHKSKKFVNLQATFTYKKNGQTNDNISSDLGDQIFT